VDTPHGEPEAVVEGDRTLNIIEVNERHQAIDAMLQQGHHRVPEGEPTA
jgi:hypothetical protein